jgi:LCP family protein required for cell wall assembly
MKKTTGTLKIELKRFSVPVFITIICIASSILVIAGCNHRPSVSQARQTENLSLNTMLPSETAVPIETLTPTPEPWYTFEAPFSAEITPIPAQASHMELGKDVQVWLLMGTDKEAPYTGRIMAMHILLVNERLAKAAMISVPPNLFVYLPGVGMRRLSTSLALGGMDLVSKTLAYNFGIRPNRFILSHPTDFQNLVDYLGGLDVSVLFPIKDACGGIPSGIHALNGQRLLCYVSYISGDDEVDRTRRQQEVLGLLLQKLVQNGRLSKLPNYYTTFEPKMETDFTLADMVSKIPFMLRLGDSSRINYALLGWDALVPWMLDAKTKSQVLLPLQPASGDLFISAQAFVNGASSLSEIVLTYEAQATQAMAAIQTAQSTALPPVNTAFAGGPTSNPPVNATPNPVLPTLPFQYPTVGIGTAYPLDSTPYPTVVYGTVYP